MRTLCVPSAMEVIIFRLMGECAMLMCSIVRLIWGRFARNVIVVTMPRRMERFAMIMCFIAKPIRKVFVPNAPQPTTFQLTRRPAT